MEDDKGRTLAQLFHELNTPFVAARLSLSNARDHLKTKEYDKCAEQLSRTSQYLEHCSSLLKFASRFS